MTLCAILIIRGHVRRLPIFTSYIVLDLFQAVLLFAVYRKYGFDTHTSLVVGWWSEAITLFVRGFATMEILHLVLDIYRGIWGLTWRVLAATSFVILICVALISRGDADWALLHAVRRYHLVFAAGIIACLILLQYYFIQVEPVYKTLLVGFCFYSCIAILLNTVLQVVPYKYQPSAISLWQNLELFSYVLVVFVWIRALARRPLPAAAEQQILPTAAYSRLSPEINYQLHLMNKQLMNFWNLEEPRP